MHSRRSALCQISGLCTLLGLLLISCQSVKVSSQSTPFGPFSLSGSVANGSSATTGSFSHLTLPGSNGQPTLFLPSLSGGLKVEISEGSQSADDCSLQLCIRSLLRPIEVVDAWKNGLQARESGDGWNSGWSDQCQRYINISTGLLHEAGKTISLAADVNPHAPVHVSVWGLRASQPSSSDTSNCSFVVTLSGDACPDGSYGVDCAIRPPSVTRGSGYASADLPASDAEAAAWFELHPDGMQSRLMEVSVAGTSSDTLRVLLHEGGVPALPPSDAHNPRTDKDRATAPVSGTAGDPPVDVTQQSIMSIESPAYRSSFPELNRRYFIAVQRANVTATPAGDTTVFVNVSNQQLCQVGYHGPNCEYRAVLVSDPFDLAAVGLQRIFGQSFRWSTDRSEIWFMLGMAFLAPRPDQNFSVGIRALDGQPVPELYLRMGAAPTTKYYDFKSDKLLGNGADPVRFMESGPTDLTGAPWFVGMRVPASYPTMGDVGLWINSVCPGTTQKLADDGSTILTQDCSGNGICWAEKHQCLCFSGWGGFACEEEHKSGGLSGGMRALIAILCIIGAIGFGALLCWFFNRASHRADPMSNAGAGYRLDDDGQGGGNGGNGGQPPYGSSWGRPAGERPAMGRI